MHFSEFPRYFENSLQDKQIITFTFHLPLNSVQTQLCVNKLSCAVYTLILNFAFRMILCVLLKIKINK